MKLDGISIQLIESFVQEHGLSSAEMEELGFHIHNKCYELNQEVVGPEEFFLSPHYMNAEGVLYPAILEALIELGSGDYEEALLTGGIGAGKSSIAIFAIAFQVYLLSCYKTPQAVFGLDPASELMIVFQSINASLSKAVDYNRFRATIENAPYFQKHFPHDHSLAAEMHFPNRIIVKPVSGEETAAIGQNVIAAIIDEINFMAVVDKSRKSIDGGTFNQADALYNSISRRRKSRFLSQGRLPGMICIVSSKRYPGQFTDRMETEALKQIKETGRSSIFVYDKTIWEVKPWEFCGERFQVFVGDITRQPRIIHADEELSEPDRGLVKQIPVELKGEFERDMMNALRDIAAVSTLARHPFMMNVEAVSSCFGRHKTILNAMSIDFDQYRLEIIPSRIIRPQLQRFVHVDLAVTGDSAGVVMGCVTGFKDVYRGSDTESLPEIHIDFSLEVVPPKGGEILFFKIRDLLYKLRELGVNIKWISFDSFQSRDSIQILRQKGFTTGVQSVDKTTAPYEMLKNALYDGRVSLPEHHKLFHELKTLEKDAKKGKIDHSVGSSKDIADAFAGVVYGLTMRREIWVTHGMPLMSIPVSLKEILKPDNVEKI